MITILLGFREGGCYCKQRIMSGGLNSIPSVYWVVYIVLIT